MKEEGETVSELDVCHLAKERLYLSFKGREGRGGVWRNHSLN